MNASRDAARPPISRRPLFQPSSLESCTSMDPGDYVWGELTPQHQLQLSGHLQMALMSTFFSGAAFFPGCPLFSAPWMVPFPQGTLNIPTSGRGPQEHPRPAGDSNLTAAIGSPYAKIKTGTEGCAIIKAGEGDGSALEADGSRNVRRRTCKVESIEMRPTSSAEPLDLKDIRDLFHEGLFQQGDCFSSSPGSKDSDSTFCSAGVNSLYLEEDAADLQQFSTNAMFQLLDDDLVGNEELCRTLADYDQSFEQVDCGLHAIYSGFDTFQPDLLELDPLNPLADFSGGKLSGSNAASHAGRMHQKTSGKEHHAATARPLLKINNAAGNSKTAGDSFCSKGAVVPDDMEDALHDLLDCSSWHAKLSAEDLVGCLGL